jgi:protein-tyrosine phosphatase
MDTLYACYKVFLDKSYDYIFCQSHPIKPINRIYKYNTYYDYLYNIVNQYCFFFSNPTHIIDNIYLGSAFNAASYQTLKNLNIKHIINVTQEITPYFKQYNDFDYKIYKLYDNNDDNINIYLDDSYNYIENCSNNILIHCYMGSSRSATIVIHYLMKKYNMTLEQSIIFVKEKRNIINLTEKFKEELHFKKIIV